MKSWIFFYKIKVSRCITRQKHLNVSLRRLSTSVSLAYCSLPYTYTYIFGVNCLYLGLFLLIKYQLSSLDSIKLFIMWTVFYTFLLGYNWFNSRFIGPLLYMCFESEILKSFSIPRRWFNDEIKCPQVKWGIGGIIWSKDVKLLFVQNEYLLSYCLCESAYVVHVHFIQFIEIIRKMTLHNHVVVFETGQLRIVPCT